MTRFLVLRWRFSFILQYTLCTRLWFHTWPSLRSLWKHFQKPHLARLVPDFEKRGVKVIAISSDTKERTDQMAEKLNAPALRMGYGLNLDVARQWGLYISTSRGLTSIGIEEPVLFSEPAVYIVRPDTTLYYGAVQTMPFARPNFADLLGAIDFALAENYPARGEYTGSVSG